MKLLFDQNISFRVVNQILAVFPEAKSVRDVNLYEADDVEIWKFAQKENHTIVTQDEDFHKLYLLRGFPPKIIWVKTGNLSNQELAQVLINKRQVISNFLEDDMTGILEIVRYFHLS